MTPLVQPRIVVYQASVKHNQILIGSSRIREARLIMNPSASPGTTHWWLLRGRRSPFGQRELRWREEQSLRRYRRRAVDRLGWGSCLLASCSGSGNIIIFIQSENIHHANNLYSLVLRRTWARYLDRSSFETFSWFKEFNVPMISPHLQSRETCI